MTTTTNPVASAPMNPVVGRLSKTQKELYEAMLRGVVCHYMRRFIREPYYFRSDNMKRCTSAVEALLKKGFVKKVDIEWRGHRVVAICPPNTGMTGTETDGNRPITEPTSGQPSPDNDLQNPRRPIAGEP